MNKTYLVHHGIKGQRWGVRRYQNDDGTLTPAGRKKYDVSEDGTTHLKDSYRRNQNRVGIAKVAIGTVVAAQGFKKIAEYQKDGALTFNTTKGKRTLSSSILSMTMGAIVISSAVNNFLKANSNKTFNTTGMGPTPETFTGKPKTKKQVIAIQNRQNKK